MCRYNIGLFRIFILLGFLLSCNSQVDAPDAVDDQKNLEEKETDKYQKSDAKTDVFNQAVAVKTVPYTQMRSAIPKREYIGSERLIAKGKSYELNDYSCEDDRYGLIWEYDRFYFPELSSEVVFPGALIQGGSVSEGKYVAVGVGNRRTMAMKVRFENSTIEVDQFVDPVASSVRVKFRKSLDQFKETGVSSYRFSLDEIKTKEVLDVVMGVGYRRLFSSTEDFTEPFQFKNDRTKHRYLIKSFHEYFQVSTDSKSQPSDYFKDFF